MNGHREVLSTSWRKVALPALAIIVGALTANLAVPSAAQAASREMATYSCETTNACHAGEKECCAVEFGLCSTLCVVKAE